MARKLFVNLPVKDLQRSIAFFTKLGFSFNPKFTDETATCMLIGEDAYAMLITEKRFAEFAKHPIGDVTRTTSGIYAFSVGSRSEVDELMKIALESGGTPAKAANDLGFMYQQSFFDPDGHHWEVFWMDPAVAAG